MTFVDCGDSVLRNSFAPLILKQTGMDSDQLYLPQEIITNILKRLPVKSLMPLQCVCKQWKNLIKSPSFIAEHLQQSSHKNPSLLFECRRSDFSLGKCWRLPLFLLGCDLQVREVQIASLINSLDDVSIVGSCIGLLCVEINRYEQYPGSLILWNPATTGVRHVPRTKPGCSYFLDCVTGFGFCPIVNDYQMARNYSMIYGEVFFLGRGSWTGINIGHLKGVKLYSKSVTVDGVIFWLGLELEDDVKVIVSLDIAKEVFTLIPKPPD